MATQLIQILTFTNVGIGAQATLPHNINENGRAVLPDIVERDDGDFSIVSISSTSVTVRNDGVGIATLNLWLERKFSMQRAFGGVQITDLSPQPFVPASGGASGGGVITSSDFTGDGSAATPLDLSMNVTMPGQAEIAGIATPDAYTLKVSAPSAGYSNTVMLKGNVAAGTHGGATVRWANSAESPRFSMGNDSESITAPLHDFWLYDNVNLFYNLYIDNALISALRFGTTNGRLRYDNTSHDMTFLTNGALRLTLADALATFATAVVFATDIRIGGSAGPLWASGAGSPEGVVTAPGGSLYSDTTTFKLWVKESASGNTGWVQK